MLGVQPAPGAPPGTLIASGEGRPRILLVDYSASGIVEREIESPADAIPYLTDDLPSTTWVDVQGLGDLSVFVKLGEVLGIHPLALEDVVNVPERPKTDAYPKQQVIIARHVGFTPEGHVKSQQVGLIFGDRFILTVQETPGDDNLTPVRTRLRSGKGPIRTAGSDYLAYAILDSIIDGFYPVLDTLGERVEDLEIELLDDGHHASKPIHELKRQLLVVRRAIWPQRDMVNSLLRDESPHITRETRLFLRDTYDHIVHVMDMTETFREVASSLMDLYLSSASNRMNEVMKVLTIISTVFLPMTFLAGVYGMNFDDMPELHYKYGYPIAMVGMVMSGVGLLIWYWRKGWLSRKK